MNKITGISNKTFSLVKLFADTPAIVILLVGLLLIFVGCDQGTTPTSQQSTAVTSQSDIAFMTSPVPCNFTTSGTTMSLQSDCSTDHTITIPDGFTLDGNGHTITAVNPPGGHFKGAVIANAGDEVYVTNLTVTASNLENNCESGEARLRGILFKSASGSITHTTVIGINKGASGCQEGNAIEVRNVPFDGSHPDTETVEIAHNTIDDYQKTGIVANGDVNVSIQHNDVGASATQENLAANSIQLGYGAQGAVKHNRIYGNQWFGFDAENSNFAGSAVLVIFAGEVEVSKNNLRGNSDIGLFIVSGNGAYNNNRVFDRGKDGDGYDIGVADYPGYGEDIITNNKVRGFDTPYIGVNGGRNKTIPGPNNPASRPSASAVE